MNQYNFSLPTTQYIFANKIDDDQKVVPISQNRSAKRGRPRKGAKTPTKSTDDESEEAKVRHDYYS